VGFFGLFFANYYFCPFNALGFLLDFGQAGGGEEVGVGLVGF
jgi:hypothetical protein